MATPSSFNEQDIAQISNYLKSNWSKVIESDPKLVSNNRIFDSFKIFFFVIIIIRLAILRQKKISPPSFEAWSTENNKR